MDNTPTREAVKILEKAVDFRAYHYAQPLEIRLRLKFKSEKDMRDAADALEVARAALGPSTLSEPNARHFASQLQEEVARDAFEQADNHSVRAIWTSTFGQSNEEFENAKQGNWLSYLAVSKAYASGVARHNHDAFEQAARVAESGAPFAYVTGENWDEPGSPYDRGVADERKRIAAAIRALKPGDEA